MKILLADDHALVRRAIRQLLDQEQDFDVVGEASDGREAVELSEDYHPDVLVADLAMPRLNGIEVARELHHRESETRVVVLSMHGSEAYVGEALRSGVYGYVLKDAESYELLTAIRQAHSGHRYLCEQLQVRAARALRQGETRQDPLETLSLREREVMQLTVEGLTSSEAGERLHISHRTVEKHRSNLMKKLGLSSKDELIRYAFERGLRPSVD